MNDLQLTVAGNVGGEPMLRTLPSGHKVVNFSVASTSRRFDREQRRWVDGVTSWVRVTAWRTLAENIAKSLHKGQPVIVTGRYQARLYQVGESTRMSYELEATHIGHDLLRGTSEFRRHTAPSTEVDTDESGGLGDVPEGYFDDPVGESALVDTKTGDILDPFTAELATTS